MSDDAFAPRVVGTDPPRVELPSAGAYAAEAERNGAEWVGATLAFTAVDQPITVIMDGEEFEAPVGEERRFSIESLDVAGRKVPRWRLSRPQ